MCVTKCVFVCMCVCVCVCVCVDRRDGFVDCDTICVFIFHFYLFE